MLSFLLPGLGHLYLETPLRGAVFFGAFIAAAAVGLWTLFVPLVALLAGWDAFRAADRRFGAGPPPTLTSPEGLRASRFALVGIVGFLAWMALVSPRLLPVGSAMESSERAEAIASRVRAFRRKQGHYPTSLAECLQGAVPSDPWGSPYTYRLRERDFEIRSPGRDRILDTPDDLVYRYR